MYIRRPELNALMTNYSGAEDQQSTDSKWRQLGSEIASRLCDNNSTAARQTKTIDGQSTITTTVYSVKFI